jgi:hypothetical protein
MRLIIIAATMASIGCCIAILTSSAAHQRAGVGVDDVDALRDEIGCRQQRHAERRAGGDFQAGERNQGYSQRQQDAGQSAWHGGLISLEVKR